MSQCIAQSPSQKPKHRNAQTAPLGIPCHSHSRRACLTQRFGDYFLPSSFTMFAVQNWTKVTVQSPEARFCDGMSRTAGEWALYCTVAHSARAQTGRESVWGLHSAPACLHNDHTPAACTRMHVLAALHCRCRSQLSIHNRSATTYSDAGIKMRSASSTACIDASCVAHACSRPEVVILSYQVLRAVHRNFRLLLYECAIVQDTVLTTSVHLQDSDRI
jgi:hypothetical protein